jgi:hypothetical protein
MPVCKYGSGNNLNWSQLSNTTTKMNDNANGTPPFDTTTYETTGSSNGDKYLTVIWDLEDIYYGNKARVNYGFKDTSAHFLSHSLDGASWTNITWTSPVEVPVGMCSLTWGHNDGNLNSTATARYWRFVVTDTEGFCGAQEAACGEFRVYHDTADLTLGEGTPLASGRRVQHIFT